MGIISTEQVTEWKTQAAEMADEEIAELIPYLEARKAKSAGLTAQVEVIEKQIEIAKAELENRRPSAREIFKSVSNGTAQTTILREVR